MVSVVIIGPREEKYQYLIAGDDDSLKAVQDGYRNGLVTKDNFEVTLRAHKKSQDEMKSEWRDKAAQLLKLKS